MNQLITVESEKKRMYDILANHLGQLHKMETESFSWVITWTSIVTKAHKYCPKELEILPNIGPYMQSVLIEKTLESKNF